MPLRRPDPKLANLTEGPASHRRRRDGFKLTDRRMARAREVADEVDYCIYCHERDKDSCSKGFARQDRREHLKKNPLGIPLDGCPLDEQICEMHLLRARGRLARRAGDGHASTTRCARAPATASATTA